ncbi:laccase domain-containing protein 1 isoform X1 [Esox lucius]|uniref:Purine nucleoside phosphorylase LACC1 n=2 Tax=Esox lucius TaxID=8010 RepID=A0A3P8ZPG4_ESOLU|nr:laccase domain-containing protein 1 isoform X1 [Esox lucius]
MSVVLIIDLIHCRCPQHSACVERHIQSVTDGNDVGFKIYLLFGPYCQRCNEKKNERTVPFLERYFSEETNVHILDFSTITESMYRFKLAIDKLDLHTVRVSTTTNRVHLWEAYQEQLFTEVYSFDYIVSFTEFPCPGQVACSSHDEPVSEVKAEVCSFLQQLPAQGDITILRSTLISGCFSHGFSTRTGGISSISTLFSLNLFCSSKRRDPRTLVDENIRRLALKAGFYPRPLHPVKVDHGSDVWAMGKEEEPQDYDGIVTNQSGVVIAAPGADCMPLLFTDPVSRVIGAAHAGWKGTLLGVAMATVNTMVMKFGSRVRDIVVAIGPSVGVCCFTLNREHAAKFYSVHPDCVSGMAETRPHVNIRLATRILLERGGVLPEHIHDDTVMDRPSVTLCTSCHPEAFFSHVRDGPNFGTQLGFLWMEETRTTDGTLSDCMLDN